MRISTISRPRMQFTDSHAWIDLNGSVGFVGVSAHRLQGIEKILHVKWCCRKGTIEQGVLVAEVTTSNAVIPVYAPVACRFLGANHQVENNPDLMLQSPHDKGWLFFVSPLKAPGQVKLLSPGDYQKLVQEKSRG